jgi:hypothetical protein
LAIVYVDFSPVQRDIHRVLSKAANAAQQERAVMWGLNQVGAKALTKTRRELVTQTSVPYGRIMSHVVGRPAHSNRMSYRIEASDKAIPLKEFLHGTVRAGQKSVPYRAWGKSLVARGHAFIMGTSGGGKARFRRGKLQKGGSGGLVPVKRVASGHKAGSLKALWGPVVPLQMLSEKRQTYAYLTTVVPVEFVPVLEQKLDAIMAGAGGKTR